MLVLGCLHEKEMDRCGFEGPPESNLPLKTFVLLSFRTELWCLKIPKKQLIEKFPIIGYFPIKRNKFIYSVKEKTTCVCHNR